MHEQDRLLARIAYLLTGRVLGNFAQSIAQRTIVSPKNNNSGIFGHNWFWSYKSLSIILIYPKDRM